MSWFAIGVKCVCIRSNWEIDPLPDGLTRLPMLNEVLTIADIVPARFYSGGTLALVFEEIPHLQNGAKVSYNPDSFRPLISNPKTMEQDISLFTPLVNAPENA